MRCESFRVLSSSSSRGRKGRGNLKDPGRRFFNANDNMMGGIPEPEVSTLLRGLVPMRETTITTISSLISVRVLSIPIHHELVNRLGITIRTIILPIPSCPTAAKYKMSIPTAQTLPSLYVTLVTTPTGSPFFKRDKNIRIACFFAAEKPEQPRSLFSWISLVPPK